VFELFRLLDLEALSTVSLCTRNWLVILTTCAFRRWSSMSSVKLKSAMTGATAAPGTVKGVLFFGRGQPPVEMVRLQRMEIIRFGGEGSEDQAARNHNQMFSAHPLSLAESCVSRDPRFGRVNYPRLGPEWQPAISRCFLRHLLSPPVGDLVIIPMHNIILRVKHAPNNKCLPPFTKVELHETTHNPSHAFLRSKRESTQ